jgi:cytochrome c556
MLAGAAVAGGLETNPYLQIDNRMALLVDSSERNQVLFDMRELLHGMFHIQNALARHDLKAIPDVVMPMGKLMQNMPQSMLRRMPDEYKYLGSGLQAAYTNVAQAAIAGDHAKVDAYLAEALTYCSGCHDSFRFVVGKVPFSSK